MASISPKSVDQHPLEKTWRYFWLGASDLTTLWQTTRYNFIVSPYKLTAHANHCTVSSLILCDWYLFSKLKAINFLYKYSFQTCGKEETTKIEVVNEARTQLLTWGFEKLPVFQGITDELLFVLRHKTTDTGLWVKFWSYVIWTQTSLGK